MSTIQKLPSVFLVIFLLPLIGYSQPGLLWETSYEVKQLNLSTTQSTLPLDGYSDLPLLQFDPHGNLLVNTTTPDTKGNDDVILLKYSSEGDLLWEFKYGGESSSMDFADDFIIDSEGNIVITGGSYLESEKGSKEYNHFILKISPDGELIWDQNKPVSEGGFVRKSLIEVDSENNYYLLLYHDSANGSVLQMNSAGNVVWQKDLVAFEHFERFLKIVGSSLFTIAVEPSTQQRVIIEYDLEGNIKRQPEFDAFNFTVNEDHYYWLSFYNYGIAKYNFEGEELWSYEKKMYSPRAEEIYDPVVTDIFIDEDKNIYITGQGFKDDQEFPGVSKDSYILTSKLNSDGELIWEHSSMVDQEAYRGGVALTQAELGVIVTGSSITEEGRKDVMIYLDYSGNKLWQMENENNYLYPFYYTTIHERYSSSYTYYNAQTAIHNENLFTVRQEMNADSILFTVVRKYENPAFGITGVKYQDQKISFKVYPNPTSSEVTIKLPDDIKRYNLIVTDISGASVYKDAGTNEGAFNLYLNVDPGLYYITISSSNSSYTEKIIIN